ncbi:MAG: zinc ABC transporter substrate-binding protein [Candidatus Saccharibacteria bacterium]|nr:zinc ABC transporter substrate-binding protein [Pseudorhodobacter sp.]
MRLIALLILFASPAMADVPKVVTDFGPVQSLVLDVMGDLGPPQALLPTGGDPHDFQLRPSQADLLSNADVVFWVGPQLMPALGDALTALAPKAQTVALLQTTPVRAFAEGGTDPHAWLDPVNGKAWLGTIAETLSTRDPDNADIYRANALAAQDQLTTLDGGWQALLTQSRPKPFVAYHDALGYFTDHFRLTMIGAIELSDATPPSAARLFDIQGIITSGHAVCVFPEAGRDAKLIAALTEGLPVRIGAPQDIEFITTKPGPGQYARMLDALVQGLVDCLNPP